MAKQVKPLDPEEASIDFGDSHAGAERSLEIIKKYGFTTWCFGEGHSTRFEYLRY